MKLDSFILRGGLIQPLRYGNHFLTQIDVIFCKFQFSWKLDNRYCHAFKYILSTFRLTNLKEGNTFVIKLIVGRRQIWLLFQSNSSRKFFKEFRSHLIFPSRILNKLCRPTNSNFSCCKKVDDCGIPFRKAAEEFAKGIQRNC